MGEDGHFTWGEDLVDGLGAVFGDHVGGGDAGDGDDEVGGAGVDVWGEHAAGAEVEHCLLLGQLDTMGGFEGKGNGGRGE